MRRSEVRMGKTRLARLIVLALAVFGMIMAAPAVAPAAEALGKRVLLGNGMVLLLSERHELPLVSVSMAIKAGGVAEPADKPGLASMTASLLMQGTARRSANQISREIDFIGGSLGVGGGADHASANLRVLKKDLGTGIDLLSDVLMHPAFDQKEIDRKVKETLASIRRSKDEPDVLAREAFDKAVFGAHPYGRTNDDVADYLPRMARQDIVDFYNRRYGPNDCVISVVGDVTETEIAGLLNEAFKDWKPVVRGEQASAAVPQIGAVTVNKIGKTTTQANIAMGHIGISRQNPDYYAVSVMNYILGGGGFSSRLMDNIRDNRGLAYDVHSAFSAQKEPGAFQVWVQTKNESANEAIAEIFKELNRIRTEAVSDKELADAKAYLTGSFPLKMDTYAKIAGILTSIEIYGLGLDYPRRYPGLINAVTKDDILRVAKKYIDPGRMVVVVLGDQEKIKLKL